MALAKDITTKQGIVAGYWKIVALNCVFPTPEMEQVTKCVLRGWQNQTDREQYAPIDERSFAWTGETAPTDRQSAYDAIKQTDEFAGSTDV